jgi:CRISPR-associated protein Cas1
MVELFRPMADAWVWEMFREREFTARDFSSGGERPGTYLKKEGRKRFFQLYEEWARSVRSGVTAEVRALASRIMDDGQDAVS